MAGKRRNPLETKTFPLRFSLHHQWFNKPWRQVNSPRWEEAKATGLSRRGGWNRKTRSALPLLLSSVSLSSINDLTNQEHIWIRQDQEKPIIPVLVAVVARIRKSYRRCRSYFLTFLFPPASAWLAVTTVGISVLRLTHRGQSGAVKRPDRGGRSVVSRRKRESVRDCSGLSQISKLFKPGA